MAKFPLRFSDRNFFYGTLFGLALGLTVWLFQNNNYSCYDHFGYQSHPFPEFDSPQIPDPSNAQLNHSLAEKLLKEVKILCWVTTTPQNHKIKARHVKNTWGKRCNKLVFMSTQQDSYLPAVALLVTENRKYLWWKTREALKYIYTNYFRHDYDWFFKADDDTYVIMENLRYLLYNSNSSHPVYYGCKLKGQHGDYMSGGAGYVLSKEALRRFVEEALPNTELCKAKTTGDEDVELAQCLKAVGVGLGPTLDEKNRHTFTPLFVNYLLIPGYLDEVTWYQNMMYNPQKQGFNCCSNHLISTHYVTPYQMYLLEYFIYHVTPFGVAYQPVLDKVKNIENDSSGNNRARTTVA